MALCSFNKNFHMFDSTPVENLFIHEFMLKAPGDFVKVYLYGLKQCYHPHDSENSLEAFAHALGMETSAIQNAFHYWSRQGILQYTVDAQQRLHIEYINIKDVLYNRSLNPENNLYKYKDFNDNLQQIFENRLLTPQEYMKIYDWIETLSLPMEVVLMMIRFNLSQKGTKINLNYLDKVAESWAREGITTLQKAEEYIEAHQSYFRDTAAVLKYLGIHRLPSKAEMALYRKWIDQWGYNLNAILTACKETTKIQSPSFAYLDRILLDLHKKGLTSSQAINGHQASRDSLQGKMKELYLNLGYRENVPAPEHMEMYQRWLGDFGLDHEVVLEACRQSVRSKHHTFEDLDRLLVSWVQKGLTDTKSIQRHLEQRKTMDNEILAVLSRAGESRAITPADRKLYMKWTKTLNMPFELILQGAEYSITAQNKLSYLNQILENWHNRGVTTLSEAKTEHARHKQALDLMVNAGQGTKKQLDFNKFSQRSYTEAELEHLFEDFEKK